MWNGGLRETSCTELQAPTLHLAAIKTGTRPRKQAAGLEAWTFANWGVTVHRNARGKAGAAAGRPPT